MVISKKLLSLTVIFAALFVIFATIISTKGFFTNLDILINSIMPNIQNSFFTLFSKLISVVFDTISMIIISIIIAIIIFLKDSRKDATYFVLTILTNAVFVFVFKELIQRARPLNALIVETSFSFPSGHVTTALVFFGFLTYLIFKKTNSKKIRLTSLIISIAMVAIIAFTRLYLNVHYLTDILGGLCLGAFILTLCILIKETFGKKYNTNF